MTISKKNIIDFNDVYVHDFELKNINIDYFNYKVKISLYCELEGEKEFNFNSLNFFSISRLEPWGAGMYVSEIIAFTDYDKTGIDLEDGVIMDADIFMTELLLNSGDKIRILSKELQIL